MKKLLIIGAGGHGKVIADTATLLNQWSEIAFLDDRYPEVKQISNLSIIGKFAQAKNFLNDFTYAIVAIGDNQKRLQLSKACQQWGFILPSLIHPSAFVSSDVVIDIGSVIFAQVAINAGVKIGMASIINTGAVIEHDCCLGNGVHISPNAALAGGVTVGDESWIGLGANVIQKISIGSQVKVGAGSVIIRDIQDQVTVVGIPAKEI